VREGAADTRVAIEDLAPFANELGVLRLAHGAASIPCTRI
jgi:hypothetical protein